MSLILLNGLARDSGYLASERHGHCRGWAGGKHLDCDDCRAVEGDQLPLQILHTALAGNNKSKFMTERRLTMFLWENHIFIIPFSHTLLNCQSRIWDQIAVLRRFFIW